ncbi:nuclease homologue [Haladaptatus litoreus]|uniref:Nuclease homologue n=1 Tax=Haladaptatus litoreus TaxID=553468 RepID=A0A1N7FDU6_9EURY|nr:thermonuclease family protein [Haladaptatus litoreus]SIR98492.1 nuclease homologue [Haladaptatus litoreus]
MHRSLPAFGLILFFVLAGCLGGFGLDGSSDDPTTTTTKPQPQTEAPATTTVPVTTSTIQPTSTTKTTASSTTTSTETPTERTTTTFLRTQTTARVDAPEDSDRFEARVTKIVDPTTITIEHDGETQTVDLIGVKVPKSGLMHKRALQTTNAQLAHSTVTVVTDPKVESDGDGHLQVYVYTGNWLYNTQLLRSGYARVADGEFSKRTEFERKQQEAKQGGYGLWKNTTTTA